MNVLRWVGCLLILKVTIDILKNYPGYLPPDFTTDFLRGRESEFFGVYQWAFYPHLLAGPLSLVLGMVLLSKRIRQHYPRWHRRVGKLQVACTLLVLVPSGFWMAFYAQEGLSVKIAFALLAIATGMTTWFGWNAAVRKEFAKHRLWMLRSYVLLCSAVFLRLIGGAFVITGIEEEWTYRMAAWVCWLVPLAVFELTRIGTKKRKRVPITQ